VVVTVEDIPDVSFDALVSDDPVRCRATRALCFCSSGPDQTIR
jgi:hypothetical protein